MLHFKLKGMSHRVPCKHIFCCYTPSTPRCGQKVKTYFLAESSHVAYPIKEIGIQSTMQAHILSLHTNSTPGVGVKGQIILLLKVVMLHIKLMGIEHRAPYKHILCPYTHPYPWGGVKRAKHF